MKNILIITLCLCTLLLIMSCSKEDSNTITIAVNNTSSSGSDTSSTSGTTGPTTGVTSDSPSDSSNPSEELPINLMGSTPEDKTVSIYTTIPSGASEAIISLYGYDFDYAYEGTLYINNGSREIQLFGVDNASNNNTYTTIQYIIPVSWITGNNSLKFTHSAKDGYIIESISITY